ncbi:hypothetical protein NDU88_002604 [Pleurodeles waltl]|uniref:Uncharacterized protein n=1 Tax=Pleurodeles waltl TaxID=8319 RepID=A0AAV7SDQ9_PLEWA|nr:hypothetical protein NDU88_002604 [Pleurodeles waltl]
MAPMPQTTAPSIQPGAIGCKQTITGLLLTFSRPTLLFRTAGSRGPVRLILPRQTGPCLTYYPCSPSRSTRLLSEVAENASSDSTANRTSEFCTAHYERLRCPIRQRCRLALQQHRPLTGHAQKVFRMAIGCYATRKW